MSPFVINGWTWELALTALPVKLKVRADAWYLDAYFSGPDFRYKGTHWRLEDSAVMDFADALEEAWQKLLELDVALPAEGEFKLPFRHGITIYVRSRYPGRGLALTGHYGFITGDERVADAARELRQLPTRAKEVQIALDK